MNNQATDHCCTSSVGHHRDRSGFSSASRGRHGIEQCSIAAGAFFMGDADGDGYPADGERPVHPVQVDVFQVDATSVTNSDFAAFVEDTGYVTDADTFGFSAVFHLVVAADDDDILSR